MIEVLDKIVRGLYKVLKVALCVVLIAMVGICYRPLCFE